MTSGSIKQCIPNVLCHINSLAARVGESNPQYYCDEVAVFHRDGIGDHSIGAALWMVEEQVIVGIEG